MVPIKNSKNKEEIRKKNEAEAYQKQSAINLRVDADIRKVVDQKPYSDGVKLGVIFAGVVFGCIAAGFDGFLIGGVIGAIIVWVLGMQVKEHNKSLVAVRQSIRDAGDKEIQKVFADADAKTRKEIQAYDAAVKVTYEKIMKNPGVVQSMVAHNVKMFQRMVSHANTASHMKFIEAPFTFEVRTTGIYYYYQSNYTNPQDDFDFHKERFRPLQKDTECEGVAEALARMTITEMKKLYPPNSLNITVSHNDATVTLHFKAANKNFVVAKSII